MTSSTVEETIFTSNVNRALTAIRDLDTGIVYVNHGTTGAETHLPFGGRSGAASGIGRVGGTAPMESFTELQTVIVG